VPSDNQKGQVTELGRIKLVNPPLNSLARSDDGLFRTADGTPAAVDDNVFLHPGALEASNVNPAEALVNMINLSRQFDMNMKLLQNAEQNDAKANQILTING
jgi:flagellar basal-body rod protein FlgF